MKCLRVMLLATVCAWVTSACTGPGYFEPVQPASSAQGVLYLYRPEADNPGVQPLRLSYPDIVVDGENMGQLKFNHHLHMQLDAGKHHIKITGLTQTAKWEPVDIDRDITITAGEVKYMKLDVQYDLRKMNLGQHSAKYLIRLVPMTPDDAIYEIRETESSD